MSTSKRRQPPLDPRRSGFGQFTEAEPLLRAEHRDLAERAEAIPAEVREVRQREAIERLVRLYEAWGKSEEADGWRWRLAASQTEPALPDDVFAGSNAPANLDAEGDSAAPGP